MRSLAGKKSVKIRANKRQQTSTNPTSVKSVQQKSTNPTVSDSDSDSDSDSVSVSESVVVEKEKKSTSTLKNFVYLYL